MPTDTTTVGPAVILQIASTRGFSAGGFVIIAPQYDNSSGPQFVSEDEYDSAMVRASLAEEQQSGGTMTWQEFQQDRGRGRG